MFHSSTFCSTKRPPRSKSRRSTGIPVTSQSWQRWWQWWCSVFTSQNRTPIARNCCYTETAIKGEWPRWWKPVWLTLSAFYCVHFKPTLFPHGTGDLGGQKRPAGGEGQMKEHFTSVTLLYHSSSICVSYLFSEMGSISTALSGMFQFLC